MSALSWVDPLKSKNDETAHAPDSSTLVPWVETLVSSAVDAAAVEVEAGTEVHLSRKCRKSLELLVKQISQVKAFRTAAQQPYVRSVDSKGNVKMLFCDTGNNASSVMALDRFEIELKHNPGRFSEVMWYDKEVSVQGIEKGGNQISMVGAVGQTLYEPGTGRPLKIWTQLVKNCDTGAADVMLGSKIMRKSEWDAEVDIGDEELRINNPDDDGGMIALPIQWSFLYTDTPQGRVVKDDGRETNNRRTAVSGRAQVKMMAAEPQLETESTVRLHPKLSAVKQVMAVVLILVSMALQLDPGMQRMAKVAVKRGADVLPGCTFGMIDTDRLSTVTTVYFRRGSTGLQQFRLQTIRARACTSNSEMRSERSTSSSSTRSCKSATTAHKQPRHPNVGTTNGSGAAPSGSCVSAESPKGNGPGRNP